MVWAACILIILLEFVSILKTILRYARPEDEGMPFEQFVCRAPFEDIVRVVAHVQTMQFFFSMALLNTAINAMLWRH